MRVEEGSPGWYADPRGQSTYRFWDGEQWTDLVASNLEEVGDMNRSGRAMPSPHWKPVTPLPPKKDWFDQLLPWLVADEKTGHTPLGIALWLIAWVALTIFLCSGGC